MNFKNIYKNGSAKARPKYRLHLKAVIAGAFIITCFQTSTQAQKTQYSKPSWWFGSAGAANINFYRGSTQKLNADFTAPTAFHEGKGVGLYVAPLVEYHAPNTRLGAMLQVGYDNRSSSYEEVTTPCNCPADLKTNLSYITIEPSLRLAPFRSNFYLYAGPRFAFNITKSFTYEQGTNPAFPLQVAPPDVTGELSDVKKNLISGQIGAGYDIPLSSQNKMAQFVLSPFVSFQPYFGQNPRSIETWNISTVRAGATFKLGTGHKLESKTLPVPPVTQDRDGDGVLDVNDKCPDTPGLASLQGCPDRDGDGIADGDDACPDKAGVAKYKGCPVPDTDSDGINDELDRCPTVKGLARYQGCPIPDSDSDGVNDEEDKCPKRAGPVSNQGCPVISKEIIEKVNFAAKNVFFATGSFKLLPKSYRSLDEIATIMRSDDLLQIQIDGHTDSQGNDESNQLLSQNRAKAVSDYLVSKGVPGSRSNSAGYGETKPVADNKTAAGRAKNRRVEMTVKNF